MGVQVPSPALEKLAGLAQLVEHLICNQRVGRSNRLVGICGSSSVVEHHLAKVGVAGSNPVFRFFLFLSCNRRLMITAFFIVILEYLSSFYNQILIFSDLNYS